MQTKEELATALNINKSTLTFFAYRLDDDKKYSYFSIPKRSGGSRRIEAPVPVLKNIQKKIASILKELYIRSVPFSNHSFGKKRDIITNASAHLGKRYVFKCDIKDFYPSIGGGRIFGVLTAHPFNFSDEVAHLITKLCTYEGRLPQGAPTSPVLSNMVIRRLDRKLMKFSQSVGGFYTRYVDDITISFMTELRARQCITSESEITSGLQQIFQEEDFEINQGKNRLLRKRNRQIITGVLVNEKLNVKRSYVRDLRNLIYTLNRHGSQAAQISLDKKSSGLKATKIIPHIEGKLRYLRRVKGPDDKVYIKLASNYAIFNPNFVATEAVIEEPGLRQCIILAEGKTDYTHLKAAFCYFKHLGLFQNLDINFEPHPNIEGFADLDQHVTKSAGMRLGGLYIAIFDSDEAKINSKYMDKVNKKSDYLYVIRLPKPHFLDDELFCIEMLYTKYDLNKTDKDGRRIYFTSEFNKSDYSHCDDEMITVTNISFNKLVVDTKVYRVVGKNRISVGLTKNDFALHMQALIESDAPPDLSGFKNVFDVIQEICDEYYAK